MEEWKSYKLCEICDLIPGFAFKSADFGDYRTKAIKIGDIQPPYVNRASMSGVNIEVYDKNKLSKFLVKRGDFVLAMTGATIGKIGRYIDQEPAYLNQRVLLFRPNGDVNPKFVYYSLLSPLFQQYVINHIDSETAQPNISGRSVSGYEIALPSRKEQDRIALILSTIDDKIELNTRINHNLEEQARALYKSWFVDFEPFKGGNFVDSELGLIPEGWRVGTLSELGDIVAGGTPSKTKPEYYTNNGIAWLTPKDLSVKCNKFTARGEIDITEDGYKNSSTKLMPRGSVLFSSRAPIGYISIAKGDICTNQGFKSVVPSYAGTAYLYYWLCENTEAIEAQASGSTFKEASGSLMRSFPALVPEKSVIDSFEKELSPIFNEQEILEEEINYAEQIRDSLLPRLMSGELFMNC